MQKFTTQTRSHRPKTSKSVGANTLSIAVHYRGTGGGTLLMSSFHFAQPNFIHSNSVSHQTLDSRPEIGVHVKSRIAAHPCQAKSGPCKLTGVESDMNNSRKHKSKHSTFHKPQLYILYQASIIALFFTALINLRFHETGRSLIASPYQPSWLARVPVSSATRTSSLGTQSTQDQQSYLHCIEYHFQAENRRCPLNYNDGRHYDICTRLLSTIP